jgi:hypothetical protein
MNACRVVLEIKFSGMMNTRINPDLSETILFGKSTLGVGSAPMMLVINAVYECLSSCFGVRFWYGGRSDERILRINAFWIFLCRGFFSKFNSGMMNTRKIQFFGINAFLESLGVGSAPMMPVMNA